MKSGLYVGTVRHRRRRPRPHDFRYRMFMMYLDLDELPDLFDRFWLWSARRPALAWFRRRDYLAGAGGATLAEAVRDLVAARTGHRPSGPIRMLTHLRYYGLITNPVTFYYAFDRDDARVEAIVAEITNTPWRERHAYVLRPRGPEPLIDQSFTFDKAFHVSPFMDMDHRYDWRFSQPDARLLVRMENATDDGPMFNATLDLERREISGRTLAGALIRFPWMTFTVLWGIYWQALRLWIKRTPFYVHPAKRPS